MTYDPESASSGGRPAFSYAEPQRPRFVIPSTRLIRPCAAIEPETKTWEGLPSLVDRFSALTEELPLAGANALKTLRSGELAITARLRAVAPWFGPVIDHLDQQWRLQLWTGQPWIDFRPLLLVGPPGTGKSHLARLIAEASGCGHSVLSLAGVADASTVEGSPRAFTNTTPCFPALLMSQHRTANPIAVVDEVDKTTRDSRQGDPLSALLSFLEPSTATTYWDRCLLAQVDVSNVSWLLTANSLDSLPAPLRSRLDIFEVKGPAPEHFPALLTSVTLALANEWGLAPELLPPLEVEAEALLEQRFAKHRSVRRSVGSCGRLSPPAWRHRRNGQDPSRDKAIRGGEAAPPASIGGRGAAERQPCQHQADPLTQHADAEHCKLHPPCACRARERGITNPFAPVAKQVLDNRSIVDPTKTLACRDERASYQRLLGQVTESDSMLQPLVDHIGFGHRGEVIERGLEIDTRDLARLRRRLKRRANTVAQAAGLMPVDKGLIASNAFLSHVRAG